MDQNDAILFSVKVDQTEAIKQTSELSIEIAELVKLQKEITAAGEQNSEMYQENAALLRSLKKEQSDVNRTIDNSVKAFKSANGSIEQQRANLSLLTQQYNKLSKEERESAEVGKKLQSQIKSLSDELKRNESAIGDNRRNVGAYRESFSQALAAVGQSNGIFKFASQGFEGLNMVMKANPFGLIMGAIGGLIALFSRLQPAIDLIEKAMGGLSAVVSTLANRGAMLFESFSKLLDGDFSGAADSAAGAFTGLSSAMDEAYESGKRYVEVQQEIEDQMDLFRLSAAEQEKQIAGLMAHLKDKSLTEKERLAIANQISKIEKQRSADELDYLGKSVQNEKERLILQLKNKGIATENLKTTAALVKAAQDAVLQDDLFKPLIEAQVNFTNAEKESLALTEKVEVRRSAIQQAEADKRKKAAEDLLKLEEKIQKDMQKLFDDFDKQSDAQTKAYFYELKKKRAANQAEEENEFAERQTTMIRALNDSLITQQQYDDMQDQLLLERLEKEKQALITNFEDTRQIELKIAQAKLYIKQKGLDNTIKLNQAEVQSNIDAAKAAQGLITELAGVFEEGSALQKAAALTNVGISLGTAIGNITATSTAPTPDNLATGGISGFIKYATFLGQVLGSIGAARQAIGGMAAGGGSFYTKGPTLMLVGDNPNGREKVTVEPIGSRGKTFVNKNSNLVAMAGGGTLFTDGGASVSNAAGSIAESFDLKNMFKNLPAPIVKVTDIDRVNRNRSKIVKVSELS